MRLVSLNVGLYEKNNDLLTDFLRSRKADILCLQEVTRQVGAGAKTEYISKPPVDKGSADLPFSFYAPLWQTDSHKTTNYHNDDKYRLSWGGFIEFGNYLRSRYPIRSGANVFVENHFSYVTDWATWPDRDYRAVQVVDIVAGTKPLRILNYHGIWTRDKKGNAKTVAGCTVIRNLADEAPGAVIIAGDFNLFPDTPSMNILSGKYRSLVDEYKIKTTRPASNELHGTKRNVVDYILVSPDISVTAFRVIDTDVSDHLPLVVDFELQ